MAPRLVLSVSMAVIVGTGGAAPPPAQPALPDLVLLALRPSLAGVRIGRCNTFEVLVRNAGPASAAPTRLRFTLARPGPAQAAVETRTLALAELGPGQQRVVLVGGVHVPEPGPWRAEAVVDALHQLAEANEGNNSLAIEIGSVPALCPG